MKNEINKILKKYDQCYVGTSFWNSIIEIDVTTEGSDGASCWNDNPSEYFCGYDGEEIDGIEILKEILYVLKFSISDEDIDVFAKHCINKENTSDRDYYGNFTNGYIIEIDLSKIPNEEIIFYLKMKEII